MGWGLEVKLQAPVVVAREPVVVPTVSAPTEAVPQSDPTTSEGESELQEALPMETAPLEGSETQEHVPEAVDAPEPVPGPAPELDADLAITLGRPKMAEAPTGGLAALLGGKSMLVEVEEKKEEGALELSDTSHLTGDYNEEKVKAGWAALSEHLRGQNRVGLAATLLGGEFVFEDPTIRFTVANEVQYEEMKECAAELLHFVRSHVGSGQVALEVFVSEVEAAPAFLSPKDRYMKWAGENPALEVLRKRLDLDLG